MIGRPAWAGNGRQETITFGRYGVGGITLSEARERLGEAMKMIAAGKSLAKEKARDLSRVKDAEAYPERRFPVTGPGSVCVLCQQELASVAADRLNRFEAFVRDNSRQYAEAAHAMCSRGGEFRECWLAVGLR